MLSQSAAIDHERKWPDDIQPDAELSGIAFTPVPSALNDRFAFDLGDTDGMKQSAHFRRLNRRYVADADAGNQHLDRVRIIFIGRLKPQQRGTFLVHALVGNPARDFCEIGLIVRFADDLKAKLAVAGKQVIPHFAPSALSYCSPVSPEVRFFARSISVTAIKISARVFKSGASSIACFSGAP